MAEKGFNDPKLAINKVYTKTGDGGKTSLVGGQRVLKSDLRIEAYGTVDELNAFVGALVHTLGQELAASTERQWLSGVLVRVQHELFNLGSLLATLPADVHPNQAQVKDGDITQLEADIDRCNGGLPSLRSFVLPGGSRANTDLHVCRTVCRRAERVLSRLEEREPVAPEALRYLNRLSDAFFVWSRWVIQLQGGSEVLWEPNKAASGG